MNKSFLILLFVLILSVVSVSASLQSHYKFDNDYTDAIGYRDGTNSGTSFYSYGVFNQSVEVSGGDYISMSARSTIDTGTYSFWAYFPDGYNIGDGNIILSNSNKVGSNTGDWNAQFKSSTGQFTVDMEDSATLATTVTSWDEDTWYFLTVTWEAGDRRLYINGQLNNSDTVTDNIFSLTATSNYVIGTSSGTNNIIVDDIRIYNEVLDSAAVQALYDDGEPYTNLTITSTNYDIFNVTITRDGYSGFFETTNGSLVTNISDERLYNITITPGDEVTYIPYTVNNYDSTNKNLLFTFEKSVYAVTINAYDLLNDSITDFNLTSSINYSTNGTVYVNTGLNNITLSKSGYYNLTREFNILSDTTESFTGLYNAILNISVINYVTGTSLSNFSCEASYGFEETTINNYINIPSIIGHITYYNISKNLFSTLLSNYTMNSSYTEINEYIFLYNSVEINLYHEENRTLIDDRTISIDVRSDYLSQVNTTTTGNITISFLSPENYELRVSANGKDPRSYFITVSEDSTQKLDIFLSDNISTKTIRTRIIDTGGDVVEGAIIRMQKQYSGELNWITVEDGETNSEGITDFSIVTGSNTFYRFIIIYNDEIVGITTATNFLEGLTDEIYEITVSLEGGFGSIGDSLVNGTMTFNTTGVNYFFIDPSNKITSGFLEVTYLNVETNIQGTVCNTTYPAQTGSIFCTINYQNNTIYYAKGYVSYTGSTLLVLEKPFFSNVSKIIDSNSGLLYAVFLFAIIVASGIVLGILPAIIFGFISLGLMSYLHIVNFPLGVITSLIALTIILFVKVRQ